MVNHNPTVTVFGWCVFGGGSARAVVRFVAIAERERIWVERTKDDLRVRLVRREVRQIHVVKKTGLDGAGQSLMRAAVRQLRLSARGYHRVLKLARTIADLACSPQIGPAHLAEAIQYRPRRVE